MKPKIIHIGGSHSVHVADLVRELDKLGYPQCVFSYNAISIIPKHIPVYYYPYNKYYPDKVFPKDDVKMRECISKMLRKEKPDIIHGNFLIFCCVAIGMVQDIGKLPTILSPWSARALTKNKVLHSRISKCFANSRYVLINQKRLFDVFKNVYPKVLKDNMYRDWTIPLYLQPHHDTVVGQKDVSAPRVLSARVMQPINHQDLLVNALPNLFEKYPSATATLIVGQHEPQGRKYFCEMIELAKNLGVYDKCNFINRSLSQEEFSALLKSHNIVYSVSESDLGESQTANQSAYAGNVTLTPRPPKESIGVGNLVDGENVLCVNLTNESVLTKLMYAADNLKELCDKFFLNSRKLSRLSVENTIPKLTKLYTALAARRKGL